MGAPAEVVAGAVHHETPGGGGQKFVQRALHQRGAVLRPAGPAGADVDHAGPSPGRAGDEVDRFEQPHRVTEVRQPPGAAIRQVDEDEVRAGRDADGAARLAVPGGDIEHVRAVRTAAAWVRDGWMVAQPLVGPRVGQRVVDLLTIVDGPVLVRVRARPGRLVPLIPERKEPGPASVGVRSLLGGPAKRRRVHVHAPVHRGHHHARPGQGEARVAADVGRVLGCPSGDGQAGRIGGRLESGTEAARRLDADDFGPRPDRDDVPRPDPAGRHRAEAGDDPHVRDLDPRPGEPDDRLDHPVAVGPRLGPQQFPQGRVHGATIT